MTSIGTRARGATCGGIKDSGRAVAQRGRGADARTNGHDVAVFVARTARKQTNLVYGIRQAFFKLVRAFGISVFN